MTERLHPKKVGAAQARVGAREDVGGLQQGTGEAGWRRKAPFDQGGFSSQGSIAGTFFYAQNILGSCTVSLALGPVSLSPFLKNQLTSKCPWLTWEWDHFLICSLLSRQVGRAPIGSPSICFQNPATSHHLQSCPLSPPSTTILHPAIVSIASKLVSLFLPLNLPVHS